MDLHNSGNAPGVEIVHCIKEAGLTPDATDLTQLAVAVKELGGLSREEIREMIDQAGLPTREEIREMIERAASPYHLCEVYYFRHPVLKPGFQPATGGLLENAAALYPEAWAYLQSEEGRALCTNEENWQAMTRATWATLADGTKVGWDGVGGAPFYALHMDTGALRLPDLRGMYAEAAGFDGLAVGGAHGDAVRDATGVTAVHTTSGSMQVEKSSNGVFSAGPWEYGSGSGSQRVTNGIGIFFQLSRMAPTANKVQPRAWGALACVYLGRPR